MLTFDPKHMRIIGKFLGGFIGKNFESLRIALWTKNHTNLYLTVVAIAGAATDPCITRVTECLELGPCHN